MPFCLLNFSTANWGTLFGVPVFFADRAIITNLLHVAHKKM
jgi:hypothetical protein